jgi:hypothetical protein
MLFMIPGSKIEAREIIFGFTLINSFRRNDLASCRILLLVRGSLFSDNGITLPENNKAFVPWRNTPDDKLS